MIPLVREVESLSPIGSENCCFCMRITPYWYQAKDVAVCPSCAKEHEPSEVPTKQEWCDYVGAQMAAGEIQ